VDVGFFIPNNEKGVFIVRVCVGRGVPTGFNLPEELVVTNISVTASMMVIKAEINNFTKIAMGKLISDRAGRRCK
jgi:hypothetical protein